MPIWHLKFMGRTTHATLRLHGTGVAMLSSVLNSDRAVAVNIEIMRAFVRLRAMLASNAELALRLDELEKKYDTHFRAVFDAIRQLMIPPDPPKRAPIGFRVLKEPD